MKSSSLLITLLLLLPLTSFAQEKIKWNKDGSEMVLISAGSFEMGDHFAEGDMSSAQPVHTVELDAFYMDVNEVTVGQFKRFLQETGHSYSRWDDVSEVSPTDKHPMIYVSWLMPPPIVNGQASGFQQKRNGSTRPVEDWAASAIHGEMK